jgi:tetratricopeptide (TPR) repeat protein
VAPDPRLETARAVARARPDDAKAWFDLGLALQRAAAHEEAIEAYDKAIALAPKSASAFHNRGLAWRASGRRIEAAEDFRRAVHLAPRLADATFWRRKAGAPMRRRHSAGRWR